ncbi:MAG: hypothetical protein AB1515_07605, partial [Nitrospirota bacterium]
MSMPLFPWNDPGSSFSDFLRVYQQQPSQPSLPSPPVAIPPPASSGGEGTLPAGWAQVPHGT